MPSSSSSSVTSSKMPHKIPSELSWLTPNDLQQIALICAKASDPAVLLRERLTNTRTKLLVAFHNISITVIYSKKTKRAVPITEDLFIGPVISRKELKRRRILMSHGAHTKKRLQERFNISASNEDLQKMASMCRTKYQHIKIEDSFSTRSKNLIHFKGTDMVTIYEDSSDSIVTVMPPEYLPKEQHDWLYIHKHVRYKQMLKHTKEILQ